jgi:hypothetical protein
MAAQIVVGLYESKGYAQDARNRLKTEGVPESDISLVVLHETGPVPSTMEPELAMMEADPLILGNVRETYARFIKNGETAVLVRAARDEDAQFATDVLSLFAPLVVEVLQPRRKGEAQATPAARSAATSSAE